METASEDDGHSLGNGQPYEVLVGSSFYRLPPDNALTRYCHF
jgi:hypothetical protein